MATDYHIALLPDNIYHLFNHAVGEEKLFKSGENYLYFLKKYSEHLKNICDTYCYCLLPNHFHLLVKIKDESSITNHFKIIKRKEPPALNSEIISDFIMERFSNWLNGYTKAFNKLYHRKGALFLDYTKRSIIDKDESFSKLIHYIHANPVHHGFAKQINKWIYSSYNSLLSNGKTLLLRDEVLTWFGGKDEFIKFHQQPIDLKFLPSFE
jgi:putative transposase